jgi:hypothetical protein
MSTPDCIVICTPDVSKCASTNQTVTRSMRISASTRSLIDAVSRIDNPDVTMIETLAEICMDVDNDDDCRDANGNESDAAIYVAESRIYVISSSFVRWFIHRLHEMKLIQSMWLDIFQHCIPTIQNTLATSGLSDAVWTFAFQPCLTVSRQIVRVVSTLKQVVYAHIIASPTRISVWIVDCFLRCMLDNQMLRPWVTYLLVGSTCSNKFAERLIMMGLTNATLVSGMITDHEMKTLDASDATGTLDERRLAILAQMKQAAIRSTLYEDELINGLVRCLVERLREDGTISHVEYTEWITHASVERFAMHLQQQGCTNYGLCRFVLNESLDLRKMQFAQKLKGYNLQCGIRDSIEVSV